MAFASGKQTFVSMTFKDNSSEIHVPSARLGVSLPEIGDIEPANVKSGGIFNLAAKKSNAKMYKENV